MNSSRYVSFFIPTALTAWLFLLIVVSAIGISQIIGQGRPPALALEEARRERDSLLYELAVVRADSIALVYYGARAEASFQEACRMLPFRDIDACRVAVDERLARRRGLPLPPEGVAP